MANATFWRTLFVFTRIRYIRDEGRKMTKKAAAVNSMHRRIGLMEKGIVALTCMPENATLRPFSPKKVIRALTASYTERFAPKRSVWLEGRLEYHSVWRGASHAPSLSRASTHRPSFPGVLMAKATCCGVDEVSSITRTLPTYTGPPLEADAMGTVIVASAGFTISYSSLPRLRKPALTSGVPWVTAGS